jgi:hypothetical protein
MEFTVAFPSVEILRMCACGSTFTLPIQKIKVSIQSSTAVPEMTYSLSSVWVRVIGILNEAKTEEIVALISQSFGKFLEVDEWSLLDHGTVRLRIMCPDPSIFPITLPRFFFGEVSWDLVVELDEDVARPRSSSPYPSISLLDEDSGEDGDSSWEDSGDDDDAPAGDHLRFPAPMVPPPASPSDETSSRPPVATQAASPRAFFPAFGLLSRSTPEKLAPVDLLRWSRLPPRCLLAPYSLSMAPTFVRGQESWGSPTLVPRL